MIKVEEFLANVISPLSCCRSGHLMSIGEYDDTDAELENLRCKPALGVTSNFVNLQKLCFVFVEISGCW